MEEKVRNLIYIEDNIAYQKCYSFEKEQVVSNKIDLTSKDSTTINFLWQLNNIAEHATNGYDYSPKTCRLPIIFSSKGIVKMTSLFGFDPTVLSELELVKQKANNSINKNIQRMADLCEELFPYMDYRLAYGKESINQDHNFVYFLEKHQEICTGMIMVSDLGFAEFYDIYSAVLQPLKPWDYDKRVEALIKKYSK